MLHNGGKYERELYIGTCQRGYKRLGDFQKERETHVVAAETADAVWVIMVTMSLPVACSL